MCAAKRSALASTDVSNVKAPFITQLLLVLIVVIVLVEILLGVWTRSQNSHTLVYT